MFDTDVHMTREEKPEIFRISAIFESKKKKH